MNETETYDIPTKRNLLIFCVSLPATWGLLWLAAHGAWYWMLVAAWLFALVNNTPFSLLHEAAHGVFAKNRKVNEFFGVLCACCLPTSYVMQRISHLGHHQRNRTVVELFDYYLPDQTKPQRDFLLYAGNLCGFYWFCIPVNLLVYLFLPWLYSSPRFIEGMARRLGFEPYVRDIAAAPER
jgi:fatty acid desaturase